MSVLMRAAAGLDTGAAPITFVASSVAAQTTSTTAAISVNKPSGVVDGDLLIFVGFGDVDLTWTPPAGWSTLLSQSTRPGPIIFHKIASSEGATFSFSKSVNSRTSVTVFAYRNAVVGFCSGFVSSSTGGILTAPELLIPPTGGVIIGAYGAAQSSNTFTTPSGMSVLVSDSDADNPSYSVFYQNIGSGLTGTKASDPSGNGDSGGALFSIFPSSYTPPTPQFIASASTQNTATGATLTINKPTGTQDGDLMVAVMSTGDKITSGTASSSGWTEIVNALPSSSGAWIAYKVASSEGASYTITASSSAQKLSGSILTYRGAVYDTAGTPNSTGADPIVANGVTAANNYTKLIGIACDRVASETINPPSSMTVRVTDNDTNGPSYVIADETVGYGATGSRSFSLGVSIDWAILLTIKPT